MLFFDIFWPPKKGFKLQLQEFLSKIPTYSQLLPFFHYIIYLLLVTILRDTIYNIAPAAKLKQIEIILCDIDPIIAPINAPNPVAIPEKIT